MTAALNDNAQLDYTQSLRRQLVQQFMADGKFPDDPKMVNVLLNALKDHDKVTLTLKRIDADKDNADADRLALQQFQRISTMLGSKDPSKVEEPVGDRTPSFNPNDIPEIDLVPGELETKPRVIDYDELMAKLDKEHREGLA